DPYDVKMVDRSRPARYVGKDDGRFGAPEQLVVAVCPLSALLVALRQMRKLDAQDTCLDGVEPSVVPLDVVEVLHRLAVIAQHPAASRQRLIVGGHGACFAAGP